MSTDQARHDAIYDEAMGQRRERERKRRQPPLVRLWEPTNTGLKLRGQVAGEYAASFQFKLNDTGQGTLALPWDHHLAEWAVQWWNPVSYTHLTLPTKLEWCRSRWSPYH